MFSKYTFLGTQIDVLGAADEVLGFCAEKRRKSRAVFYTETVARFMVRLPISIT